MLEDLTWLKFPKCQQNKIVLSSPETLVKCVKRPTAAGEGERERERQREAPADCAKLEAEEEEEKKEWAEWAD